jgi:hypothetical protein
MTLFRGVSKYFKLLAKGNVVKISPLERYGRHSIDKEVDGFPRGSSRLNDGIPAVFRSSPDFYLRPYSALLSKSQDKNSGI